MKIYIGETSIFYVPTPLPEKIHLDIACHKVYCRERLGGCIYNTYTKKPIKNAKITIKNHCHCETSFTNRKGHYKLYAPFINTFCDIYIYLNMALNTISINMFGLIATIKSSNYLLNVINAHMAYDLSSY